MIPVNSYSMLSTNSVRGLFYHKLLIPFIPNNNINNKYQKNLEIHSTIHSVQ